jgi:multisubunit Na+/H+ antiporter MnhE subunit
MSARLVRTIAISVPEFCLLALFWMLVVSKMDRTEFWLGLSVAFIAAVADGVVKSKKIVDFLPHHGWLALIFLEPWYALEGTWEIFLALGKRLLGRPSDAQFKVIAFTQGGDDQASQARRALAVTYFTIPPNFVVLGIDRDRGLMLVHQVAPSGVPLIAKKLGAKE